MNVQEIIAKAQQAGANIGEAYETTQIVAENVEGVVVVDPRGFGYRLKITDATGTITPKISTNAFAPGKNKYNLAIQKLTRDIDLTQGGKLNKGTMQLRCV
jgi:hypothetical protein